MRESTIFITPDSGVRSVTMTNTGAGYTSVPTVTFTSSDGGYGATGVAQLTGDAVTSVRITNIGQGYLTAPTVSFSGGGGTNAAGTAVLTNGIKYPLDANKDIALLTEEGYGLPPIEHITQRGPFQHGESLRDTFLRPRIFQLLIRKNACDRNIYWQNRLNLLDVLRPNRIGSCAGQGTLRRITSDGRKFDINVIIQEGPGFASQNDVWDRFSYHEAIRLVAYDPVFFNPTSLLTTYTFADQDLVFNNNPSAVFPIVFGMSSGSGTIVYTGTWLSYPTIRVYGPINNFAITNETTDKTISLSYPIPDATYVQIGLEYGRKYIQLNDGTNLLGYSSGDIATFALLPGSNVITIDGYGYDAGTYVEIEYYLRYIGI